jgi:hypothetical protein
MASSQLSTRDLSAFGVPDTGVSELSASDMMRLECLFYPDSGSTQALIGETALY